MCNRNVIGCQHSWGAKNGSWGPQSRGGRGEDGEDPEHGRKGAGRGRVELPVIEAVQHLEFGRTVVSETEAPNVLVDLV